MTDKNITWKVLNNELQSIRKNAEICNSARLNLVYDYNTDASETQYSYSVRQMNPLGIVFPINIFLGMKSVSENIVEDYISDSLAVKTIWRMFHEVKHVNDHISLYNSDDVPEDVQIVAETEIVGDYIPEYRRKAYQYLSAEYSAESYALTHTLSFFAEKYPNVDCQSVVVEWFNDSSRPFCEVGVNNIEDLESRLNQKYQKNMYEKKFGMIFLGDGIKSKAALRLVKDTDFLKHLYSADDGKIETKYLVRYIADTAPQFFANYRCIQKEYVPDGIIKSKVQSMLKSYVKRNLPEIDYPNDEELQDEHE